MATLGTVGRSRDRGGRMHLALSNAARRTDWTRWLVLFLAGSGIALFAAAFFQSWWSFWLYAPQYPGGLHLTIGLRGMGGDVREIDLLNHYIGMKHLEDAAPFERQHAGLGVALVALLTAVLFVTAGRRLNKLIAVPAMALPLGFLVDSLYWLVSYGHRLDPRAPLKIHAFTPQMFGNGKIGQFETFAQPATGFWLALAGVAFVLSAVVVRFRVCAHCSRSGSCGATCTRLLVLPDREPRGTAK